MNINSISFHSFCKTPNSKVSIDKNVRKNYLNNQNREFSYATNIKRANAINFRSAFGGNIEFFKNNPVFRHYEVNKYINYLALRQAGIPNLQLVYNKGVRGKTLSSSHNTKFIPIVKDCGIDTIIDLRTADYTPKFKNKCDIFGLKYYHIPIDKKDVPDREIIENLPLLFKLIERGKFYIACAQGKHRTDIALALNYVFNPKQDIPPYMSGHTFCNVADMEDINRRLNSVYKAMTDEDKSKLGWNGDFEKEFLHRKHILKTYSEVYTEPYELY